MPFFAALALVPLQPTPLEVVRVERRVAYAGRLGDRVTQSIVARAVDGRTVTLELSRAHTWIKPAPANYAPGDRILAWVPKVGGTIRTTPDRVRRA